MVFSDYFYYLRENGLSVSMEEWLLLMEALKKDLARSNLLEFYYLSRAVLVKKESDYDSYNQLFYQYFEGALTENSVDKKLPEKLMKYLEKPIEQLAYDKDEVDERTDLEYEKLEQMFLERMKEQNDMHNGGKKWLGTGGTSPYGNTGYSRRGIRIGGHEGNQNAYRVITESAYRDFREDATIGIRQFEVALRRLRQYSGKIGEETELDVDATIDATCQNGGSLKIKYRRPRKNAVKLLVLFDSGGSMSPYASLCSGLFQAVNAANHFQSLKIYYFHNCPYNRLYETPECIFQKSEDTDRVLANLDKSYKALFVGDASMAAWELRYFSGGRDGKVTDTVSGLKWLHKIIVRCGGAVWLNPIAEEHWGSGRGAVTIERIRSELPMYHLSVQGLTKAVRRLLGNQ